MARVLYLSYNDALGHLGQSQIIPYLKELSKKNNDITLISYERNEIDVKDREFLKQMNIDWIPLKYHKKPAIISSIYDLLFGILVCIKVIITKKIEIIHARSYLPAFMGYVVGLMFGTKLIFDMRGFFADEYVDNGTWRSESRVYRIVKKLERVMINKSEAIVVLTSEAKKILVEHFWVNDQKIYVIPCCVKYNNLDFVEKETVKKIKAKHNLINKTILIYSGSLGGCYMAEEMTDFYIVAKRYFDNLFFLILTNSNHDIVKRKMNEKGMKSDDYLVLTVKPEQVPEYLACGDFAISFITPSFAKKASSPIKLGEYLAAKLPVVTNSGVGDVDTIVSSDIGVLIKSFSKTEYETASEKIEIIINSKNKLDEKFENYVDMFFGLKKGVKEYLKIYDSLSR